MAVKSSKYIVIKEKKLFFHIRSHVKKFNIIHTVLYMYIMPIMHIMLR